MAKQLRQKEDRGIDSDNVNRDGLLQNGPSRSIKRKKFAVKRIALPFKEARNGFQCFPGLKL